MGRGLNADFLTPTRTELLSARLWHLPLCNVLDAKVACRRKADIPVRSIARTNRLTRKMLSFRAARLIMSLLLDTFLLGAAYFVDR